MGAAGASRSSWPGTERSLRYCRVEAQHGPGADDGRLEDLRSTLGREVSAVERLVLTGRTLDTTDGGRYAAALVALARRSGRGSVDCLFECCRTDAQPNAGSS